MIEAGAEPLKDLIAAMHTKVLIAELERSGSARGIDSRSSSRPSARLTTGA